MNPTRRQFLRVAAGTGAMAGLGDFGFLSGLHPVSAAEVKLEPGAVRFSPDVETLVRFLEDTPRERLLEEVALRIRRGLSYRELLTALLLAGVRNIQPRPVGFKFHAVLVVNSAHLASISSPPADRWLPIFWALDYFKSSQAQDVKEGDWTMAGVQESLVPASTAKAREAFVEAIENWDEAAADAAVVGLARTAAAQEIFELFCRYCARDFREIGHKAIYVANSWRTLQVIGWQHAEPVLRSLTYALLDRDGDSNPARSDLPADRPGRRNIELAKRIRPDWMDGRPQAAASLEMLRAVREGSAVDASAKAVELLNRGVAPQSIWDGLFQGAGELLMREPGIRAIHAVTTTNAIHYEWQQCANDEIRRYLLLQNAAFLPLFRGRSKEKIQIDDLEPLAVGATGDQALPDIFGDVGHDPLTAARKTMFWLDANPQPAEFINAARLLIFLKGRDAHDYKFSSAILEDYFAVSPLVRNRFLAAGVYNLRGSGESDNQLVKRTRAALNA